MCGRVGWEDGLSLRVMLVVRIDERYWFGKDEEIEFFWRSR